jgi:transketolase
LPAEYIPQIGKGVALTQGSDFAIIAYGPVLLSAAVLAARRIQQELGLFIKVINLPWLNHIDSGWLTQELEHCDKVISLDNHYLIGGQGDRITNICQDKKIYRLAIQGYPVCGTNFEVLREHGIDCETIVAFLKTVINFSDHSIKKS